MPGQLLKVLLQSLHGTAGKHPGISKMMQEIRQKYYFPSIATYVRNWVRDCEICIQDKRSNNTRITPELIHIPEWDLGPEDLMQINLLPELPPSGGYENIITAIDVFFEISICLPSFQPHGSKHSESHNRHLDKTRLLTYTHYNRQRKRFRLPNYTRGS